MASEGQEIIVQPGASPPPAPSGFHWVLQQIVASETGGAAIYVLKANDTTQAFGDLQDSWAASLLALQQYLTQNPAGVAATHNCLTFIGATSPYKTSYTTPNDVVLTGCVAQAGCAVSMDGSFANFAAIQNVSGVFGQHLFYYPSSSSLESILGDIELPLFKGQTIYVYMNVAGAVQVFFKPVRSSAAA